MKAITIHQPWATLIALGEKHFETRSWATKYRGPIAIHASKADPSKQMSALDEHVYKRIWHNIIKLPGVFCPSDLPTGAVVAIANLTECYEIKRDVLGGLVILDAPNRKTHFNTTDKEFYFGDYTSGRYAWELDDLQVLSKPIPAKGQQRIWNWDESSLEGRVR